MATDVAIRNGLADALDAIPGLTAYGHIPSRANLPAALVARRVTRFDSTMARGADDFEFVITVCVPFADPLVAQDTMSAFLATDGPDSVKATIESDQTLGGVVDFARVREAGEEQIRDFAGVPCMAVEFTVEVTA